MRRASREGSPDPGLAQRLRIREGMAMLMLCWIRQERYDAGVRVSISKGRRDPASRSLSMSASMGSGDHPRGGVDDVGDDSLESECDLVAGGAGEAPVRGRLDAKGVESSASLPWPWPIPINRALMGVSPNSVMGV